MWSRLGPWEWARVLSEGAEYPLYLRRRPLATAASVAIDANAVPVQFPAQYEGGLPFVGSVRGLSALEPEPAAGRLMAYTVDAVGDERYTLMVLDLDQQQRGEQEQQQQGEESKGKKLNAADAVLSHATVSDIDAPVAWGGPILRAVRPPTKKNGKNNTTSNKASAKKKKPTTGGRGGGVGREKMAAGGFGAARSVSSASASSAAGVTTASSSSSGEEVVLGHFLYYARMDETGRPFQLWQRAITYDGGSRPAAGGDRLVYEESDQRYRLGFERNRAGTALLVRLQSRDATEWRRLPLNIIAPLDAPSGDESKGEEGHAELSVVVARLAGVQNEIDEDYDGTVHLLTNVLPGTPAAAEEEELRYAVLLGGEGEWQWAGSSDSDEHVILERVHCFSGLVLFILVRP